MASVIYDPIQGVLVKFLVTTTRIQVRFHISNIVFFVENHHSSSFISLQDHNMVILSEFSKGSAFFPRNVGFGKFFSS